VSKYARAHVTFVTKLFNMEDVKDYFINPCPGGTSETSRRRNRRYRMQAELASWKGAGLKLRSVALSGLK